VLWGSFSSEDSLADSESDSSALEQLLMALSKSIASGIPAARTIRLVGQLQDVPVQILIDSGSSSSFINQSLVSQLQHLQVSSVPSSVQVAGGGMLYNDSILRGVQWTVDGCSFHFDFRTLPLVNFDVVIGMDWLKDHSPMQADWRHKWLAVPYDGQIRVLQGIAPSLPQQMLLHICWYLLTCHLF
jgi:hypothetical protein